MTDLHIHSTASDGTEVPADIIKRCSEMGLELCSITDHDNVDSQAAAITESTRLGVPYITGVEISAQYTGELHILGYGMDLRNIVFSDFMEELRAFRVERTYEFIRRLREVGADITLEDVVRNAEGNTLGRPHVALALVEKGYARTYDEAFSRFLNEGGLCYVNRRKLLPKEAIELIRAAGGTAVLAHPGLVTTDDFPSLLRWLVDMGLEGIEAHYPAHSDAEQAAFLSLADDFDLLVTCGSDFHGATRRRNIGDERRGSARLSYTVQLLRDKYAGLAGQ